MFIRKNSKTSGVDIGLAHVVAARHIAGGFEITDTNGREHQVSDFDWKLAMEMTAVATFPAQPGTFLIERCDEGEGEFSIIRQTVLGWMVSADGVVRPVVTDPEALADGTGWAVEMPTGRVESNSLTQWASAEDWLAGKTA